MRPIIFFRDLPRLRGVQLVRLDELAVEPGERRMEFREDQGARLLNEDPAPAADLMHDPEQRVSVRRRALT
jgi:hypothetical protein